MLLGSAEASLRGCGRLSNGPASEARDERKGICARDLCLLRTTRSGTCCVWPAEVSRARKLWVWPHMSIPQEATTDAFKEKARSETVMPTSLAWQSARQVRAETASQSLDSVHEWAEKCIFALAQGQGSWAARFAVFKHPLLNTADRDTHEALLQGTTQADDASS